MIQDNSFFIEESYNQEPGVVQHISGGLLFVRPQRDFSYTFTQEWPLAGQAHQLSFTIPYLFFDSNRFRGLGDILINYRYQLLSDERWAIAPRLSVIVPTGHKDEGFGNGVVGMQVALPVSRRLSKKFFAHGNLGLTVLPGVKGNVPSSKKTLTSEYIGASIVWLVGENVNVLLESVVSNNVAVGSSGEVEHTLETIVSPGLRFAINLEKLQIVPGIALPIDFRPQENRVGVFFYLSFEHPF